LLGSVDVYRAILHCRAHLAACIRRARVGSLAIGVTVAGCTSGAKAGGAECTVDGGPRGLPGEVLDLTNWKVTLPMERPDGGAAEVLQPELRTFSDPYFHVTCARDGVAFSAYCGGAKTPGTQFPRTELREMIDGGSAPASWSVSSGTHTMWVTEAVMHLPTRRPEVVTAQIHNATDDIVMIYLKRDLLYVQHNGTNLGVLDANYALGTIFSAKIVASGGKVQVYYNGILKSESTHSAEGCFFKAGSYPHSNPDFGEAPDAYAEVVVYDLKVQHD
jgi:poly(beta-D-mannuronate) lyase